MRASVFIKLTRLGEDPDRLKEIAGMYNLNVQGTGGDRSVAVGGTYEISNKTRLGITEYDTMKQFCDGILELIKIEDELNAEQEITPNIKIY